MFCTEHEISVVAMFDVICNVEIILTVGLLVKLGLRPFRFSEVDLYFVIG